MTGIDEVTTARGTSDGLPLARASGGQLLDQMLLELVSGVIGAEEDAHDESLAG